ncbi:hypothetical protein W97_07806 [Coniosporium apollinis CBS 100218]|uniref:Glycosyltransferase 2-like domain-containing protein n=1 Tax=Coniosporium apollinis (strain CBS 100218) TaxID=1168221 RepID=R7Z371_CONA1|nr:uncharacterized protein W97_07806 [Coniosporium apollinis CBS 100218]EON68548.1 hypothetical protein W97_07806 [Coniosporium apollinis CBS 100218]
MSKFVYAFVLLFLYRYLRFIVNTISSWYFRRFQSVPLPGKPTVLRDDVTVIIPTVCGKDTKCLEHTLRSCLENRPYEIIIVTIDRVRDIIAKFAGSIDASIKVMSVPIRGKRIQVAHALHGVKTSITILADDDVIWPSEFLPQILAPLESWGVGAVGTLQQIRRDRNLGMFDRIWEYLGACYIERRNFEITATSNIDGGMSCLSGRTAAFRTEILQDPKFISGYLNERWAGNTLNADDDNFVSRWLVSHQWAIVIQASQEAVVETALETSSQFLSQCLRWSRSNWRSNFTSTIVERHIWKQQPWSTYALHLSTPTCSLVTDPLLVYLLLRSTISLDPSTRSWCMYALAAWMLVAKITKLIPHYQRCPGDIRYFPVTLIFGYLHGLQKYYALFTLHSTS